MDGKGKKPVQPVTTSRVARPPSATGPSHAPHSIIQPSAVPNTSATSVTASRVAHSSSTAGPNHAPHPTLQPPAVPTASATPRNALHSVPQRTAASSATSSAHVNGVPQALATADETYPEYILDLKDMRLVDPKTKKKGDWCIRRWVDVKDDVAKEGYGIISYAWGRLKDKTSYVLAGTINHPNPNGYPTFDIGVSTEDSVGGPNLYDPVNVKAAGHINKFASHSSRLIPKGTPLTWTMPVLQKGKDGTYPFTIDAVKTAVTGLNMKYVWWDWACVPQGVDPAGVKATTTALGEGPDFQLHKELAHIQTEVTNKMRYFYPASKKGCVWWYMDNQWTTVLPAKRKQPASAVQELLECMQSIASHEPKAALESLPTQNLDVATQRIVDQGTKEVSSEATAPLFANLQLHEVQDYMTKLSALKAVEASLISLWCLQEHVLYNFPDRLGEPTRTEESQPRHMPCVVLDKLGRPFDIGGGDHHATPTSNSIFQYGFATLADIVIITNIVALIIGGALVTRLPVAPGGGLPPRNFEQWCGTETDEARRLLSRLIDTGLVGTNYDCPLLLLDARFARSFGTRQLDAEVQCLIGPLAIDLKNEIDQAKRENMNDTDKLSLFKEGFVQKLYAMYQWRMLQMARPQPTVRRTNMNDPSFWQSLVGSDRPKFAPLDLYIGSDRQLSYDYGPNVKAAQGPALGKLPDISMPNPKIGQGALVIHMVKGYKFYRYSAGQVYKGWTACVCYTFEETIPTPRPPPPTLKPGERAPPSIPADKSPAATVGFKDVTFAEYAAEFHPNILVLPFHSGVNSPAIEGIPNPHKQPWVRCAILADYNPTDHTAVFWGVGDFLGIADLPQHLDGINIALE
ncbi:hypothetical protein MMC11_001941 [Xylographa trunciseda]|nr:hypothetical protein [Xylographa trunciseda]